MRTLEDFIYDCIAFYSPKFGELSVLSITIRARYNGFPEVTQNDVRNALDAMVVRGTVLGGWY